MRIVDERAKNIRALCELLRIIKEKVESFGMSACSILRELDGELMSACGYKNNEPPKDFLEFAQACDIADQGAKEILLEFFAEFGKSYRSEQIKRCEYYLERMTKQERLVCSKLPDQKKLYATLCLSLSLILVILPF